MLAVLSETEELVFINKQRLNLRDEDMILNQEVEIVGESKVDFALLQTSDIRGT